MQIITLKDQSGTPLNFTMKDTLLVKEYKQVMQSLRFLSDLATKIKTVDAVELQNLSGQLNLLTVDQWDFMVGVVKRCYGLTDDQIDSLHNADMLFLFSELINESRVPKKNFSTPSSQESTTQEVPSS